jgi:NAD(P)-dependent dehydrogenase (short-subunit alcohol dehydrogenase family)
VSARRVERVLVTGASRGIGRAIAERLMSEGRSVALVARDEERLREVAGDRGAVIGADLLGDADVVAAAVERLGGLDGLVHAAGVAPHARLEAITDGQLELAHALHVRAPLRMMRSLASHLRAAGRSGSIVNIASTLGIRASAGTAVYSATKAALVRMSEALALELAPHQIRVNVVAPGVVDTEMVRALRLAPGEPEPTGEALDHRLAAQLDELRRLHPLGRLGTPEDVADAVLYLLDAPWVTGSVLTVDGGLTAG